MAAEELAQCLMNLFENPIGCIISTCVKNQQSLETQPLNYDPSDKRETIMKLTSLYDDFIRNSDSLFTNNPPEELLNENQEQNRLESEREETKRKLQLSQSQLKTVNEELIKTNELLNDEKVLRSKVETERELVACLAEKLELILLKYDRRFSSADKTVATDTLTNDKQTMESDVVTENGIDTNTPDIRSDTNGLLSSEIENNSRAIHEQPSSLSCDTCNQHFFNEDSLYEHKRHRHGGDRPHKSSTSNETFTQKGSLERHNATDSSQRPFHCSICNNRFKTTHSRRYHIRTYHEGVEFWCPWPYCDRKFHQKGNMKSHIAAQHLPVSEKPHKCAICDKGFIRKRRLQQHQQSVHSSEKLHKCTICDEAFDHEEALKSHSTRHTSQGDFQCSICYNWFKNKSNRNRHIRSIHDGLEFKCSLCDRKFRHKYSFCRHITTQHLSASENPHKCASSKT